MSSTSGQVLNDLKAGKTAPVYFLQGEEPYEIDMISQYLENNLIPEEQRGFNQIVVYGRDTRVTDILNHARRFPMMGERQLVIVKEAQEVPDLKQEDAQKMLGTYLENPQPSTVLVFCHKLRKIDGRSSLSKVLAKKAVVVTTRKLYDNQIPSWISEYLASKKRKATPKAVQMLANNIGNNLERLGHEIDKMLLNIGQQEPIDDAAVEKYVGISREYNAFEFQNALITRDFKKAVIILNYFDANWKNSPIYMLIGILFAFYSKVLITHTARQTDKGELARKLRVNPYFVKDYQMAARNYPLPKVLQNIHYLKEADLQIKGIGAARLTEGAIMKELTYKLIYG